MSKETLLSETIEDVAKSGHTPLDIVFIGSGASGHSCTWDEFIKLADREYDSGFGGQEVASDLVIVFADGTKMWRGEYDGSEWWVYGAPFVMPKAIRPIVNLFAEVGWDTLAQLNEGGA